MGRGRGGRQAGALTRGIVPRSTRNFIRSTMWRCVAAHACCACCVAVVALCSLLLQVVSTCLQRVPP